MLMHMGTINKYPEFTVEILETWKKTPGSRAYDTWNQNKISVEDVRTALGSTIANGYENFKKVV